MLFDRIVGLIENTEYALDKGFEKSWNTSIQNPGEAPANLSMYAMLDITTKLCTVIKKMLSHA